MELSDSVTTLKGIGPKKAELLAGQGIFTLNDIIMRFPRKYEDRREIIPVSELQAGKDQLIHVKVLSRRYSGFRYKKKSPLLLLCEDDSGGRIEVVFFNGAYIANLFNAGAEYTFYGRVTENRGALQMVHPEFHRKGDPDDIRGIIPVYPGTEGISQNEYRRMVRACEPLIDGIGEWLPGDLPERYRLADPAFAVRNIHFPDDEKKIRQARYRLIFDELLTLETGMLSIRGQIADWKSGAVIDPAPADEFVKTLPFELTDGQKEAWKDISDDLMSHKAMNRLIQGDVGSGKTVIAEMAMFAAVKSGYQAVMMAPTEILAKQHFKTLTDDLSMLGIRIAILTGSMKQKNKNETLKRLADGDIDVLIGTHALIEPGVQFHSLGLAVTDEQHRFGVEQRHMLSGKGEGINIMVMTATPIPRTLAVIIYGDLDISQIHTMPAGRKKIITKVAHPEDRMVMYDFVKKKMRQGQQAYVVAPLISESDKIDANSAEELFDELSDLFRGFRLALLHGSIDPAEKDRIMTDFADHKIDMLISTVVIEIGINVPNATVMVIENCERFGLAQMHQLRGRVGRGSEKSYCFLVMEHESDIALQRAAILEESSDGFRIAEEDLRLRGPGEIFGTKQHGIPELNISDLVSHADVLEKAKQAAQDILHDDPHLTADQDQALKKRVRNMFGDDIHLEL
ncbi:MAG: ATP-dependent DNA helicase RecG [Eubacterium sp.]|nr:ATP-dependent DNA helicase RecG [Eubacterium sp.]